MPKVVNGSLWLRASCVSFLHVSLSWLACLCLPAPHRPGPDGPPPEIFGENENFFTYYVLSFAFRTTTERSTKSLKCKVDAFLRLYRARPCTMVRRSRGMRPLNLVPLHSSNKRRRARAPEHADLLCQGSDHSGLYRTLAKCRSRVDSHGGFVARESSARRSHARFFVRAASASLCAS